MPTVDTSCWPIPCTAASVATNESRPKLKSYGGMLQIYQVIPQWLLYDVVCFEIQELCLVWFMFLFINCDDSFQMLLFIFASFNCHQ